MIIKSITPTKGESGYLFKIEMVHRNKSWSFVISAHDLLDYSSFCIIALCNTGMFYGGDEWNNWAKTIRDHLDAYWNSKETKLTSTIDNSDQLVS